MPWIICYDIELDNVRLRTANRLIEFGFLRIQKSVFGGDPSESVIEELKIWLKKTIENELENEDHILLLPCTQRQLESAIHYGIPPADWDFLLSPPNTLIL